jgi:molybdate transport system ATP-binding protein
MTGSGENLLSLNIAGPGLTLVTGANGSGKSTAARAFASFAEGASLLSAESQQAFYEAQLKADDSDLGEGVDTTTPVRDLVGDEGREHPLFAAFRLEPLWERHFRHLSTGEARKVLLLQAVLREPSLLILDDPFDGLDRSAFDELVHAIDQVAKRLSVVVVGTFCANDMPFAAEALREVAVIADRRLVFLGSAKEFAARDADRKHGRGAPPVGLGSWYAPLDRNVQLVRLANGKVAYDDEVIFDQLNFSVDAGQHTLIEGPNGSGKSTLLDMITGDHAQGYSNDLHLFGRRRGSGETVWDIKKHIGMVSTRLHRDYRVRCSVEEVLLSGLYDSIGVYQVPTPSDRTRARAFVDWLDLGLAPSASFHELSFGQQRLVLIARAAIKLPPLVVLDEPTSGLDADNRGRVLDLVESLCAQRTSTILMVTHRPDERAFWQTRIGGAVLSLPARFRYPREPSRTCCSVRE